MSNERMTHVTFYCNISLSSTCEILYEILLSANVKDLKNNSEPCKYDAFFITCSLQMSFLEKGSLTFFCLIFGKNRRFRTDCFAQTASLLLGLGAILLFFRFCQTIFFPTHRGKNLLNEFGFFGRSYFGVASLSADASVRRRLCRLSPVSTEPR